MRAKPEFKSYLKSFAGDESHVKNTSKYSMRSTAIKAILALLAVIICGLIIVWYRIYQPLISNKEPGQLPLIQADHAQVKIKPDDPGGMVVPNLDKSVYNSLLRSGHEPPKVERILPLPEEPLSKTELLSKLQKEEQVGSAINKQNNIAQASQDHNAVKESQAISNTKTEGEYQNKQEVAVDSQANMAKEDIEVLAQFNEAFDTQADQNKHDNQKNMPSVSQPTNYIQSKPENKKSTIVTDQDKYHKPANDYKIQLAALKSEKAAIAEWEKIKRKFKHILDKYQYSVEKKDIKDKGIFYRLHIGPFKSNSDARKLCKKLIANKQSCFVVKPAS